MSYWTESGYTETNVHLYSRVSRSAAVQTQCPGGQEALAVLVCCQCRPDEQFAVSHVTVRTVVQVHLELPVLKQTAELCVIILTYLFPVLFTFYIQVVLKFKKIIPATKG